MGPLGLLALLILGRCQCLERQGVNLGAHCVTQRLINRLMAFDQRLALKALAHHQCLKVIATTGEIAHLNKSSGKTLLDSFLKVVSVHFVIY